MAMKYQKGTVYPRGRKVKMWYGKYTVYLRNEEGKEVGKRRNVPLCPKAGTPKWKAEEMLHALILQDTGVPAKTSPGIVPDETVTFQWFVAERYLPMREGTWSPAYRKINTFEIKHYLVEHFGRIPLNQLGAFEIQVWLNKLATKYSQSVVRHCYINIRSILQMAKKLKFLAADPAEDVNMPQTKPVEKPVMTQEQILKLIGGIQDLHDLCLMYVGIFCGPRASEVLGLQWKSWTGTTLVPHGTAFEGRFYPGRLQEPVQPGANRRSGTGSPDYRSLAENKPRSVTRSSDVPNLRARRAERTGGAALGEELPPGAGSPDRQEVGDPGEPHHVPSHETNAGNQSAAPRHAQGCSRGPAPREHQDDGRCLCADDRGERAQRDELPHDGDPHRLETRHS